MGRVTDKRKRSEASRQGLAPHLAAAHLQVDIERLKNLERDTCPCSNETLLIDPRTGSFSHAALRHAGKPPRALIASAHNSTMPAEPSTTTDMPSTITCVASSAPLTSGMLNSRATIAACDIGPPTSVTAALAMLKRGVQIGVVVWATSTSRAAWYAYEDASPIAFLRAAPKHHRRAGKTTMVKLQVLSPGRIGEGRDEG